jgi:hypothetical protein
MGDREVNHDRYLEDLSKRVGLLSDRARSGLFWLADCGLLQGHDLSPEQAAAFAAASDWDFRHAVSGIATPGREAVREALLYLSRPEVRVPQWFVSASVCLDAPLGDEPPASQSLAIQCALFPVMMRASESLWEGVAQPGTREEDDEVFAQPVVQAAADYVDHAVAVLAEHPEPTAELLLGLRKGAGVLA